jgi:hypothetical protein
MLDFLHEKEIRPRRATAAGPLPTPADELGFARQPKTLGLGEASGFAAELFEENAIFFRKVFDHGLLVSVHPAGGGDEEELESNCHAVENVSKLSAAQSPDGLG